MWRPTFTLVRKVILPSLKENGNLTKIWYSTKSRLPRSTAKLTLVSASVGALIGAGYGGYTHYKINIRKTLSPSEVQEYPFLLRLPEYKAHYKVLKSTQSKLRYNTLFRHRVELF